VAGSPVLADQIEECVAVAVDPDLLDVLAMAARLAFLPEFVAAPRVVVRQAGFARPLQGLAGDVREHQHIAGIGILCDRRDQPLLVERRLRDVSAHTRSLDGHPDRSCPCGELAC